MKRLLLLCLCLAGCSHLIAPTVPPQNPKSNLQTVYDTILFGSVPIYRMKDTTISISIIDSGLELTSVQLTNGVWNLVDSLPRALSRVLRLRFQFTPWL